ncbi:uncharacterized protein SPPG_05089 [Spizellomyces punctatus DAOM BR117]|uniref:Uncharacterized protein n=1 Tax=Spizellomyces punctatus (strain DAOM BR117) TaxID=645134 RepID=A0A0L0HFZ2_SPIPD|nr:uncharacterized protein SPPG_05089 [Spizellomyces punctatus DAOM BR117]KNC99708.1 hypothetical protein SPPG_05089 [Spizellomyces punctatus DAOM BR117]|eukprot:XP_016607748.1 hypothetical protein SPPG_05089 [Spizellomyces punctatus DAOM BR117]
MAYYRANYLSDTYAISPPIPNLQKRQVGVALDYSKVDDLGRAKVVYSWNRNIHDKDLATKENYTEPKYEPRLSSSDVLKISAAQQTTQAYKDGLEYVKAEEDYRKKQKYLDSITPSRRGNALTIGTQASTSGLPIPDESGTVFHYPASVTSQTGLMFQAPPNGNEIPAQPRNVNSSPLEPVILTRETEIRRDAFGNDHVNHATGVAVPLDAMTMGDAYIPPIPGGFPGSTPQVHVESPQIDASVETMPRSAPIPHDTVIMNDHQNPSDVADVLERNSVNEQFISVPARTPFHFKGKEPAVLAGSKRKANAPPPIPRLNKKKQKTGDAEHDVVEGINLEPVTPPATPPPVAPPRPPDVLFAGRAPHGTKRRQYKQPEDKQTIKRRRIDAEHVEEPALEEIVLQNPEEVERSVRASRRRRVNVDPVLAPMALNPPTLVPLTADLGSEVRPLTRLRGQREAEYVVPPVPTQATVHVEPTVRSRQRKGAEDVTLPPRKKQRIM